LKKQIISAIIIVAITLTTLTTAVAQPYMTGDVNGDGVVDIVDVFEIMRFIANEPNVIDGNPRAEQAARIVSDSARHNERICVTDFLEIIKFIYKLEPNGISGDGNNPERRLVNRNYIVPSMRARLDLSNSDRNYYRINFYNNETIEKGSRVYLRYGYCETAAPMISTPHINHRNFYMIDKFETFRSGRPFEITFYANNHIEPDSLIAFIETHKDKIGRETHHMQIVGEGFTGLSVLYGLGDVNGDGEITLDDAVWILKYVAGIGSDYTHTRHASLNAARITGGESPTVLDALEILKYIAGMDNLIDPFSDNPRETPPIPPNSPR
jgi:hypothetical protein